jgi:RNA polymerase sigma-70 factor (ECF subfamily)
MPGARPPDSEALLDRLAAGDETARLALLNRHRQRLRNAIALRMDRRLRARVDPSDVIQDTLLAAAKRLEDYVKDRPLPFYPWLRQIALERLVDLERRHVRAERRSVRREEGPVNGLSEDSLFELIQRLCAPTSSPSAKLQRAELHDAVRRALHDLPERDREVLLLRHMEQLSGKEIGAILGLSEGAVYTRCLRALRRLRELLTEHLDE